MTPLGEWSGHCRGLYLHCTQQTQEKNINAPSGIQTRDFFNRGATELRLRPKGHHNQFLYISADY
jgi:hypothetical protein